MAKNIFDLINPQFFSPLSNGNSRLNYELLHLLNEKMTDEIVTFPRDTVLDWLEEYLSNTTYDESIDDETNSEYSEKQSIRDLASRKLRYFVDTGWLSQETGKDFRSTYQMEAIAIDQLDTLDRFSSSGERSVQLTQHVHVIHSTLSNPIDMSHFLAVLSSLYDEARALYSLLRGINSKVRNYLSALLQSKNASPSEILNALLVDYQNSIVMEGFENLRRRDNPSRYKDDIIRNIDVLRNTRMAEMVTSVINEKYHGDDSPDNRGEAEADINNKLDYIKNLFEEIETKISAINTNNTRYVTTARAKLEYLLNEDKALEGRIIAMLKSIESTGFDDTVDLGLKDSGLLNSQSLFQPRKVSEKVVVKTALTVEPVDPVIREQQRQRMKMHLLRVE